MQKRHPNLEYKLTDKWPTYGVISVEYKQKENNYIQILLYTETMKGFDRPMFKISYHGMINLNMKLMNCGLIVIFLNIK